MYQPIQPGIPRRLLSAVKYQEYRDRALASEVYCYWTLNTPASLRENFEYLVLPDGCIDLIFDLSRHAIPQGALVMSPATSSQRIDLGTSFSYLGIRLRPGSWALSPAAVIQAPTIVSTANGFDLLHAHARLLAASEDRRYDLLDELARELRSRAVVRVSHFMDYVTAISPRSVQDLAEHTGYSRRQLQRRLYKAAGYQPHDFVKVVRFQHALQERSFDAYADQSHYIREHKRIVGMPPQHFLSIYS